MTREETNFQAFGQELRKARESLGRSLDDIAATTRINRRHIESIEAGDLGALPTGPYVQAFLKEYARNVGLKLPSDLSVAGTSTSGGAVKSVTPASGRGASSAGPRAATAKPGSGSSAFELPSAAMKATKDTARFANQAAKSVARTAAKTTENVFKKVETGAKDAVDVFTSKSLREEAEQVRRERLGLEPLPEAPPSRAVPVRNGETELDIASLRSTLRSEEQAAPTPKQSTTFVAPVSGRGSVEPPFSDLDDSAQDQSSESRPKRRGLTSFLSTTNIVILCSLLVFGAVVFYALHMNKLDKTPDAQVVAPVIKEDKSLVQKPVKTLPAVDSAKAIAAAIPANDSLHFTLHATEPVWVSISPDGITPFKGEIKSGETRTFAAAKKFVVYLGNQRALEMTFNGQRISHLPTVANSGVVVRNLVLTRDKVTLDGAPVSLGTAAHNPAVIPNTPTVATPKPHATIATPTPDHSKLTTPPVKRANSSSVKSTSTPKKTTHDSINGTSVKRTTPKKPSTSVKSTLTPPEKKAVVKKPSTKKAPSKKSTKGTITPIDPVLPRP